MSLAVLCVALGVSFEEPRNCSSGGWYYCYRWWTAGYAEGGAGFFCFRTPLLAMGEKGNFGGELCGTSWPNFFSLIFGTYPALDRSEFALANIALRIVEICLQKSTLVSDSGADVSEVKKSRC